MDQWDWLATAIIAALVIFWIVVTVLLVDVLRMRRRRASVENHRNVPPDVRAALARIR